MSFLLAFGTVSSIVIEYTRMKIRSGRKREDIRLQLTVGHNERCVVIAFYCRMSSVITKSCKSVTFILIPLIRIVLKVYIPITHFNHNCD